MNYLIGLCLITTQLLGAAWEGQPLVRHYFHNSEMQRQWAWSAIGRAGLTGRESVLDFGCGDGKVTAELSHLVEEITGVDISADMVAFAERKFSPSSYPNLTYLQVDDPNFFDSGLTEKFDVAFSFTAFHCVPDPVSALQNLRLHMKEGGRLVMTVPMRDNPAFFGGFGQFMRERGFHRITPNLRMRSLEGCRSALLEAGWQILEMEQISNPTIFIEREELVEWCIGTMSAIYAKYVPVEERRVFFNEFVDLYLSETPEVIDKEGLITWRCSRIEVVATPI